MGGSALTGDPDLAAPPRLDVHGVSKRFPGVLANDRVDFAVRPGEIHAPLGENGAGKSTLVKMIYGVLQPDEGTIHWNGQPVSVADPRAARRLGIGMVFQHFSLFEAMTVLENIALGLDGVRDMRALAGRVSEVSRTYGLALDPHRAVYTLSVGERQRIEIVRCLLQDPELLIMDEPTSVLTPQEVERLFETLRQLASEGCSILYISHKLREIKALCHRATILRNGRVVAECDPSAETAATMARIMIGEEVRTVTRRAGGDTGAARLVVEGLDLRSEELHGVDLRNISFAVRAGEIFGIAGVAGNGQGELQRTLSGERLAQRPEVVRVDGRPAGRLSAGARRRLGVCSVPEERNGHAAVPGMSLVENAVLSGHHRLNLVSSIFIRTGAARRFAESVVRAFDVRTPGTAASAGRLSGGNLQKFVVGREVLQNPGVLVVSQPTWGVDAGAAATIHQALADLAREGAAVVVISQDLDELLAITDRLAVINVGVLSNALVTAEASVAEIGLLMGGIHGSDAAPSASGAGHAA
ncbi:MAG: ABC transporter ATP-binding protein [Hyphomicrobiales bacterium]|nr:MAG: ABC transporter ATP-binding protein [Hyphomicrobiales bacterium]